MSKPSPFTQPSQSQDIHLSETDDNDLDSAIRKAIQEALVQVQPPSWVKEQLIRRADNH